MSSTEESRSPSNEQIKIKVSGAIIICQVLPKNYLYYAQTDALINANNIKQKLDRLWVP